MDADQRPYSRKARKFSILLCVKFSQFGKKHFWDKKNNVSLMYREILQSTK